METMRLGRNIIDVNSLSSHSTSSAIAGSNPLHAKVTSVLSTSFADSEFRDALALLDSRGVRNTADSRRHLRQKLHKDVIDSNSAILDDFCRVTEQLRRIGVILNKLNRSYSDMKSQVQDAYHESYHVITDSQTLLDKRVAIEVKQELLDKMRSSFILTQDEIDILTLNSQNIDEEFFVVFNKSKAILKDAEALLGFEEQHLGLEIMEQASRHVNAAFQKLYKWLLREFKGLDLENLQLNPAIRQSIRVLAERPTLFQSCLDLFAEARERIISDAFFMAVTGSDSSGQQSNLVKPIELSAHDALRYVGDMLAWTHSATVSEREALEVLFVSEGDEIARGLETGKKNEIWSIVHSDGDGDINKPFDPYQALHDLVDCDLAGAARHLRQRVQQVIQANENTIMAYKLANLLAFYRTMFAKVVKSDSTLIGLIIDLEQDALRQFRTLVRDHIATLQTDHQQPPNNLGVPGFLEEALDQLKSIMESFSSSLDISTDQKSTFDPVLMEALDPFLKGCQVMSATLDKPNDSIFHLNCLIVTCNTLRPFAFTHDLLLVLHEKMQDEITTITAYELSLLKHRSGLEDMFLAVAGLESTDNTAIWSLRSQKTFSVNALTQARKILDEFLPSALIDTMEELKNIIDSQVAQQMANDAIQLFCDEYEHLDGILVAEKKLTESLGVIGDVPLQDVFPRSTEEVRVLLS